jgi:hypothetical protein
MCSAINSSGVVREKLFYNFLSKNTVVKQPLYLICDLRGGASDPPLKETAN